MKKERILLLGGNFFPEPTGIGKYNGEMIAWLAAQGHSCTVITTFPYYPQWKVQDPYKKRCYWFKAENVSLKDGHTIKVIRCPHYVPKNPSGINRLISEFSFFFSAYLVILALLFKKKFNYLITVAPPFEIGLVGLFYKKIRGGKLLYHIQDLQIDAARDLGMVKSKSIISTFLFAEKLILKNADFISTISSGMMQKVNKKCHKESIHFPNWVNTDIFYPVIDKAGLKTKYGFNATDKIILYSGAIGHKQGLEAIIYSAKELEYIQNLQFAICGSGPYKDNLVRLKEKMHLNNVTFLPLQPLESFNSFLNIADAHLILQKKEASDLFLPSKLSTILAVGGVPIVTAMEGSSLFSLIKENNMGIIIEPENQDVLTDTLKHLDRYDLKQASVNARQYAETNLSTNNILSDYFTKIFSDGKKRSVSWKEILVKSGIPLSF